MAVLKIRCTECGAGLSSKSGFTPGETVLCPKCETEFAVPEPEDDDATPARKKVRAVVEDDDDDRPRKKRKKRRDDDDEPKKSFKNSPLRYAILGVLVVVMIVLGVLLYQKKMREREEADGGGAKPSGDSGEKPVIPPPPGGPNPMVPPLGFPKQPNPKQPNPKLPNPKQPNPGGGSPLDGLFGQPNPAETRELTETLSKRLVGVWTGTQADGGMRRVEYKANGTFTDAVTGGKSPREQAGTWKAAAPIGTRGLKLDRTGGGRSPVRVTFEDDELVHDGDAPGDSVVLRKK